MCYTLDSRKLCDLSPPFPLFSSFCALVIWFLLPSSTVCQLLDSTTHRNLCMCSLYNYTTHIHFKQSDSCAVRNAKHKYASLRAHTQTHTCIFILLIYLFYTYIFYLIYVILYTCLLYTSRCV